MKKLLLGAVLAAVCMMDADASVFQTKSSKNNVDTVLKSDLGNYYKGMVSLVNALLVGWADSLSYAAKDPEFKNEKTQLSNANKKLKIIAKFTESILNRDREKGITSNQAKAVTAAQAFQEAVNVLKKTTYWKNCGAQLRLSIIIITNSLRSLAQNDVQFNVAGIRTSSSEGFIDENGHVSSYNLAYMNGLTLDKSVSNTSKVFGLLSTFQETSASLANNSVAQTPSSSTETLYIPENAAPAQTVPTSVPVSAPAQAVPASVPASAPAQTVPASVPVSAPAQAVPASVPVSAPTTVTRGRR